MLSENQTKQQITLMYKDKKVLSVDIVLCDFNIVFISEPTILDKELLPLYIQQELYIEEWYKYRCFYNSMLRYDDIIYCLCGMPNKTSTRLYNAQTGLSLFSYGANLTDKYWINFSEPFEFISDFHENSFADKQIIFPSTYEQTNFFQNPHISENFGYQSMLFSDSGIEIKDFRTPEICTNGDAHKRWLFENNEYYLEKIILNNEFVTKFEKIDNSLKPQYFYNKFKSNQSDNKFNTIKSKCITSLNTELISAYDIICSNPKNGSSLWEIFEKNFLTLGNIEQYKQLIDALKHYSDGDLSKIQHFDNFGFLRDSNTKKIIKPVIWSLP